MLQLDLSLDPLELAQLALGCLQLLGRACVMVSGIRDRYALEPLFLEVSNSSHNGMG
jgi:hypothetical protein